MGGLISIVLLVLAIFRDCTSRLRTPLRYGDEELESVCRSVDRFENSDCMSR